MALEELAAQPLRLAGGDVEDRSLVPALHVALADFGQLNDTPVLLEEAGGAGERDELARAAERVLEARREQLVDRELGDELVEAQPVALVDRAQQAVCVAKARSRDRTHCGNLNGHGPRGPVPNVSVRPGPRGPGRSQIGYLVPAGAFEAACLAVSAAAAVESAESPVFVAASGAAGFGVAAGAGFEAVVVAGAAGLAAAAGFAASVEAGFAALAG